MKPHIRYMSDGHELDEKERELIVLFMEEASECIHAASKLLRFGHGDKDPKTKVPNQMTLGREIGDLLELVARLKRRRIVSLSDIQEGIRRKRERLLIYTTHQGSR
jgi:hypothetical protein